MAGAGGGSERVKEEGRGSEHATEGQAQSQAQAPMPEGHRDKAQQGTGVTGGVRLKHAPCYDFNH